MIRRLAAAAAAVALAVALGPALGVAPEPAGKALHEARPVDVVEAVDAADRTVGANLISYWIEDER